MALAILLGASAYGWAQFPVTISQPNTILAAWAGELEFSRAGSEFTLNPSDEWTLLGNFMRFSINPYGAILKPDGATVEGVPTAPEEQVTSWGPVGLYTYPGAPGDPYPIGATHAPFPPPTTPGGPGQAPRRHGYFFNMSFDPASVPLAPSTSYTVSIDVTGDYCHTSSGDAPTGYWPANQTDERAHVRCTTRLTFAISKSPTKASSVDTRLAYGNPDSSGLLIPDPNASLGHLAFRPYAFKGGLFVGRMPGDGKDKSGEARIHVASPGLPAPPSTAFLMGRCVQLYCAEAPPGVSGVFQTYPTLTTSTFAQAFYDQPAITWGQRADILPPVTGETYSYDLLGVKRTFSFRLTGDKTQSSTGHSGLAILPPNQLSNMGGNSQAATGVWRYFVQDGAQPRVPAPLGVETQPVTYNVYLLSGEVIAYDYYLQDQVTKNPYLVKTYRKP